MTNNRPKRRISDLLTFELDEPILVQIVRIVDSIHRIDSDQTIIVSRDLKSLRPQSKELEFSQGLYKASTHPEEPCRIYVSPNAANPSLVFLHELGHFIDHQCLGNPGKYASSLHPSLKTWWDRVRQSSAYRHLLSNLKNLEESIQDIGRDNENLNLEDINAEEVLDELLAQLKTLVYVEGRLRYYLKRPEFFARSYAQYISAKSNKPDLIRKPPTDMDGIYVTEWHGQDFEPIAKAIDDLFVVKEWVNE